MDKNDFLSISVCFLVGMLTILVMESPYRYLFAVLMALITYWFMNPGLEGSAHIRVKHLKTIQGIGVLEAIWIAALITAFSLSSAYMTGIFVDWSEIPPINLLRALAFYPLVFFYPGYGFVNLLIGGRRRMTGFEALTLSVGVSFFLSGITGLLLWLVTGAVSFTSSYLVILINALFLMITLAQRRRVFEKEAIGEKTGLDFFTLGIVGGVIFFTALGIYAVNLPDHFTYGFDMWARFAGIHKMIAGVPLVSEWNYCVFLFYTALFIASSGIPLINAYQLTFFLAPLHILAFYVMCTAILSKRQAALATLIYGTFSGLGGLYSMYLRTVQGMDFGSALGLSEGRCYDLAVGVQGYSYFYQPITMTYASLFIFLYLALSKEYPRFARVALMTFSFATGYLTELTVIPFLIVVILLLILFNMRVFDRPNDVCLSQILGLIVSFGTLKIFASGIPVFMEINSPLFRFFPYLLIAAVITLVLSYTKVKGFVINKLKEFIIGKAEKLFKTTRNRWNSVKNEAPTIASIVCIYFLLTLFIFWMYLPPYLANYKVFGETVPWYFYPAKLGLPIFIAVMMIPFIVRKGDQHVLKLGGIIILTSFLAGNMFSYLRENDLLYLGHSESRWLIYSWGGISILASYGLWNLHKTIRRQSKLSLKPTKKIASVALLVFIMVGGISATLLTIETHRAYITYIKMSKGELNAYYDSKYVINPYGTTAAPDYMAQNKISFYAGRVYLDESWDGPFFSSIYPDFLGEVLLRNPNVAIAPNEHVQWNIIKPLKEDGQQSILPRGLVFSYLADYLPILDENEWFVLYSLPPISPSTVLSDTAFVTSHIPEEDLQHLKIIADDNQTTFWKIGLQNPGKYGLQIEESDKKVKGETSLLLNVTDGSYERVMVYHDYEEPQDWSDYDYISLYWYGTGSGQHSIGVIIYAPDCYHHLWFEWDDTFYGWRKLEASLSQMSHHGEIDLKNVTHVEVRLFPQTTNTYYLDSLALEREVSPISQIYTEGELALQLGLSMSYTNYTVLSILDPMATSPSIKTILMARDPEDPSDNLLNWIEEGGTFVLFQGEPLNETGFFSKTLKLTPLEEPLIVDGLYGPEGEIRLPVAIQSNGVSWNASEVTPIAWYTRNSSQITPYALVKDIGKGRVVYVVATPYMEALSKSVATEDGRALFSCLKEVIDVLKLPLERYRNPQQSVYAYMMGSTLLKNGRIEARSLLQPWSLQAGLPAENIDIKAEEILIGGSKLSNITLRGCTIESIEKAQIIFSQALIYPTHIPGYVRVQLAGSFNLTLTPRQRTSIVLYMNNGTVTSRVSTQDIVTLVHDEQEEVEFYLKGPKFDVESAQFEKILFDFFSGINNPGFPMSVEGGMSFKIENVDENFLLATNVFVNGSYKVLVGKSTIMYSRWLFPWEALFSPFFLLLTYITCQQIVRIIRKRRNVILK